MTDEELRKLSLPEVPDEFLERWMELFEEHLHQQEAQDVDTREELREVWGEAIH